MATTCQENCTHTHTSHRPQKRTDLECKLGDFINIGIQSTLADLSLLPPPDLPGAPRRCKEAQMIPAWIPNGHQNEAEAAAAAAPVNFWLTCVSWSCCGRLEVFGPALILGRFWDDSSHCFVSWVARQRQDKNIEHTYTHTRAHTHVPSSTVAHRLGMHWRISHFCRPWIHESENLRSIDLQISAPGAMNLCISGSMELRCMKS